MRSRTRRIRPATLAAAVCLIGASALPALADHTEPDEPLSPTQGAPAEGYAVGDGSWEFVQNFPANPGTDLEFFRRGEAVFSSSGTLGQGQVGHVGQRVLQLVDETGAVNPTWTADHGSAHCETNNPSGTLGLQHDVQVTPRDDVELIIDATDATGRCHDTAGGGLELVDASGIGTASGPPLDEVHLTRHDGTSHNVTVDATRPWIVYSSNSDKDRPWIDVLDIRSCLGLEGASIDEKRAACRPAVYRIPFEPTWTAQQLPNGSLANPFGCHDITATPGRLWCAAIHGTAIFDVTGLTTGNGEIRGDPLPCTVVDGTRTTAKVTNCDLGAGNDNAAADQAAYDAAGRPAAKGWRFLGSVNHPGTDAPGNNNLTVPSDEGVAVSHEAEPTPDGQYLLVTDERGGGVAPPGASCGPNQANPIGNGGIHVFDVSDPSNIEYATTPEGDKAVFISDNVLPMPTFCNVHLIEHVPDEQRLFVAWYSQGVKVVDYEIDEHGQWSFTEVASYTLPGAQTWAVEPFAIHDNSDGTRAYHLMTSDIGRGIDVISFTAPPNPREATGTKGKKRTTTTKTSASAWRASSSEPVQYVCLVKAEDA